MRKRQCVKRQHLPTVIVTAMTKLHSDSCNFYRHISRCVSQTLEANKGKFRASKIKGYNHYCNKRILWKKVQWPVLWICIRPIQCSGELSKARTPPHAGKLLLEFNKSQMERWSNVQIVLIVTRKVPDWQKFRIAVRSWRMRPCSVLYRYVYQTQSDI
jgi:hypothetical protein